MHKSRVMYANGCLKMKWVYALLMSFYPKACSIFFSFERFALHMFRFENFDLEMLTAWIVGDPVWISKFGY